MSDSAGNRDSSGSTPALGSFAIAMIGFFLYLILTVIPAVLNVGRPGSTGLTAMSAMGSVWVTALFPLWIVGIVLGVMGWPSRYSSLAKLGLLVNTLLFLIILSVFIRMALALS